MQTKRVRTPRLTIPTAPAAECAARRMALAAFVASVISGSAGAQMTVDYSIGGLGPINSPHKGEIRIQDVVAPFGNTGSSLLFTHQSVLGIDNKWVDGTGGLHENYSYSLSIQIDAPGQCWTLDVSNWRKGAVGAYDDGNKGWAHASLGHVDCKVNGLGHSALDIGGSIDLTNAADKDNDVTLAIDTPVMSSTISGSGSQVVTLSYYWEAYVGSTVATFAGGDEGLVLFGLDPQLAGNSEFDHGGDPPSSWGLSTLLTLTTEVEPAFLSTCPTHVVACVGDTVVIDPGGVVGSNLTYTWFHQDVHGNVSQVGHSKQLVIHSADSNDIGSYTLVISNSCGSATTCPIFLYVKPCPWSWGGWFGYLGQLAPWGGFSLRTGLVKQQGPVGGLLPATPPSLPPSGPF